MMADGDGDRGWSADILSGIFYRGGNRVRLSLSKQNVAWEIENVPKSCTSIPLNQMIAATPCDCMNAKQSKNVYCYHCKLTQYGISTSMTKLLPNHASFLRLHYAVPCGKHSWKLQSDVFCPIEDVKLKDWIAAFSVAFTELKRVNKLLVFVNPYGGKKKGVKIYEKKISPLFHLAGINSHVIVTQRPNHAREIIKEIDINKFDGIICVGGDGMFSEILNGVLLKTQKEKGINVNDRYNPLVTPRIRLGIVPAGSTNAAANCTTGSSDPVSAALLIIMGDSTGIDVCGVYSGGCLLRFAVTFLSYGYFGDVIRDSEKLRWMGPKRYDFSGFKKILQRKRYEGELHLQVKVPADHSSWHTERCRVGCEICLKASEVLHNEENNPSQKLRWLTVKGRFIAVNAAIMSCACCMSPQGISPSQHLGNGYCDVITVSSCSRFNYLRYLLRSSCHHSNPFDLGFVQVYRVREFSFSPFVTDDKTPATGCTGVQDNFQELTSSVWDCDGEVIDEPTVNAKIHCQLISMFGRGFEARPSPAPLSSCFGFCAKS